MNDLKVFSSEVIPVYVTDTGEKVVLGRELHEKLKINSKYADWFKNMCAYGFLDGNDYSTFSKNLENGGRSIDHLMKLDMAKHIAMIQRTPEGKAIRDKLIQLETNVSELSPELQVLIRLEVKQKEQDKALEAVNKRMDNIGEIVALNPTQWREDARRIIAKIARARGGMYQETNAEIFDLVDQRGGVSLATRLTNKRRRMAEEGACKSKRDRLTKVDIIAEDKKLIEIYIAVVKEMAIKNGIDFNGQLTA